MTAEEKAADLLNWLRTEFAPAEVSYIPQASDPHMRHRFQLGEPHYREVVVPQLPMDDLDSSEIIAYLERLKGGLKGPGPDLHLSYDLADGLRHRLVPR